MNNQATSWAVYLGANTIGRLADEWRIPYAQAESLLEIAVGEGSVRQIDSERFEIIPTIGENL